MHICIDRYISTYCINTCVYIYMCVLYILHIYHIIYNVYMDMDVLVAGLHQPLKKGILIARIYQKNFPSQKKEKSNSSSPHC